MIACIPAFNEEKVIANLISDVSKYVDSIVVCDDGSADDTANVSKKSDAFVIKHDKYMGKGAALKSLFDFARHSNADIIITIDGDGQFLPKEIPKLIQPIKEKKYDVVFDIHHNLSRLGPYLSNKSIKILHSTGSYTEYAANRELDRIDH